MFGFYRSEICIGVGYYPRKQISLRLRLNCVINLRRKMDMIGNNRYIPNYIEELSMLEAVRRMGMSIDELYKLYEKLSDGDLKEYINQILEEWKTSGELDDVINNALIEGMKDKVSKSDLQYINLKTYYEDNKKDFTFTECFQHLLDVAKINGVQMNIYIPVGSYNVTEELRIYGKTKILCERDTEIVRNHDGYILIGGERGGNVGLYNGIRNVQIIGGVWNGNGGQFPSKASIFHFPHARDISVIGATLMDCADSHHIEFNACRDILVRDCQFLGWFGGTDSFNEAIQLDVAKKDLTICGLDDGTPCIYVTIENNYFGKSTTDGAKGIQRAIGSHTSTSGRPHKFVNINNNIFDNTESFAVRILNYEQVQIKGNLVLNCGGGFNIRASMTGYGTEDEYGVQVGSKPMKSISVCENTFLFSTDKHKIIEVYGETDTEGWVQDVTVSDNVIRIDTTTNGYDTIHFNFVERFVCSNNVITGSSGTAIYVNNKSRKGVIEGNTIETSKESGVWIDSGTYAISLVGNFIHKIMGSGVKVTGGRLHNISNNTISGVNGLGENYNHVAMSSGTELSIIESNICENFDTTPYNERFITTRALYVTNTCLNIGVRGNISIGFTNSVNPTNGTVDDSGNMV